MSLSIYNKYNFDVIPDKTQVVTPVEELVPVFNKNALKEAVVNQQPTQGLFRLITSDVDLSKSNTMERLDYIQANPDVQDNGEA